jgi:hypothetical protein
MPGGFVHCVSVDGFTFGNIQRYGLMCETVNHVVTHLYPVTTPFQATAHYTDDMDRPVSSPPDGADPTTRTFMVSYHQQYTAWTATVDSLSNVGPCP